MIARLRLFLDLTEETRALGVQLWDLLSPHADEIIGNFYRSVQRMEGGPAVADAAVERLMVKQKIHWERLFTSELNENFGNALRRVSIAHREIDLSPVWYIAGYSILKIELAKIIAASRISPDDKMRLCDALERYVAFDMSLALSSYNAIVLD